MLGNGLRLGVSGAYFVLLARLLGPEAFGVFSAILACSNLAAPFGYWGQSELLIQRLSNRRSAAVAPEISPSLWLAGLVCSGMVLLLTPLLSLWLAETSPLEVGILLGSDLLFIALPEVYRGILIGQEQIAGVALIDTGMALGRLSAVLLAMVLDWGSLTQWAILYGLMVLLVLAGMSWGMRQWCAPSRLPALDWQEVRARLRAGWDFALGLAAAKTFTDLDKLLLPRLASTAAGGLYSAAYRVINFSQTPMIALLTSHFAELCRQGQQGLSHGCRYAWQLFPWVVGYGSLATVGVALGSYGIPWLLGSAYQETALILRWLSPVILLEGIHLLLSHLLTSAGLQKLRSRRQLAALVLNGALNGLWIPAWGWRGAALATLLSEVTLVLALLLLLWQQLGPQKGGKPSSS
ncbi:lipopolysaccharide biosynthesis protein [Synechococcus sp. H70.2]|uniref:lipopolysaccharide biosynthesis protein n=1 Tax=unclassified Synechococcus TaxID=2626047 RepID=UPI0039C10AE2